jgi:hypothetical protein
VRAYVIDSDNVGMIQSGQRVGLLLKAAQALVIARERLQQDLDGDGAVQPWIVRLVYLAHAARAEEREYLVGPDALEG